MRLTALVGDFISISAIHLVSVNRSDSFKGHENPRDLFDKQNCILSNEIQNDTFNHISVSKKSSFYRLSWMVLSLSLCVYNVHRPYGNFVYIIILAKKSIFNSNSILYRTWSVRVYDQKVVRRTHSSTFKRKVISFSLITLDSLESLVRAFWIKMLRLH